MKGKIADIVGRILIISVVGFNLVALTHTISNDFSTLISGTIPGIDIFDQMRLVLMILIIITIPLLTIKSIRNNKKTKLRVIGVGGWALWILLSLIIIYMKGRLREGQPI